MSGLPLLVRDADGFASCPAPAKINLFLHVTGRRADGYHCLQTVFRMLDRCDVIHVREREDGRIERLNEVPGVPAEQDLVVRAARLLQEKTGCRLGADLRVEKRLPMGGGLGGGSSDAATTLLALNRLWGTDVPRAQLQEWALTLGADVPFFVFGRTAWAEGVGEALQAFVAPAAWYVVVEPPVAVPTVEIFRDEGLTRDTKSAIISGFPADGFAHWQQRIEALTRNDLQPVACRRYPDVQRALDAMTEALGSLDVAVTGVVPNELLNKPRMSGSGACVFQALETADQAARMVGILSEAGWRAWCAQAVDEHPLLEWAREV